MHQRRPLRRRCPAPRIPNTQSERVVPPLKGERPRRRTVASLANIGQQCELAHDQDSAARIDDRPVHPTVFISEYPQLADLVDRFGDIVGAISPRRYPQAEAVLHRCLPRRCHPQALAPLIPVAPLFSRHLHRLCGSPNLHSLRCFGQFFSQLSAVSSWVPQTSSPGVSGGTIALIFGIYERLIASIRAGSSALGNLLKADISGFKKWIGKVDWWFIIPLGVGILSAVAALAHILERLLTDQAVLMSALFMGLVAGVDRRRLGDAQSASIHSCVDRLGCGCRHLCRPGPTRRYDGGHRWTAC